MSENGKIRSGYKNPERDRAKAFCSREKLENHLYIFLSLTLV